MPGTYARWYDLDHPRRREWTVSIDVDVAQPLASDEATFALSRLFQPYAGAVAGGEGATRYGATFTLEHGGDALGVLRAGIKILKELAREAGLPGGRFALVEVEPVAE